MCVQRRFKTVCTYIQSDQCLNFTPEEMLGPKFPIVRPSKALIRLRQAQADQSIQ